ncbi:MAG: ChaN family lipoprotein [Bacteroidia bacterium]
MRAYVLAAFLGGLLAQDKPAYALYSSQGKRLSYTALLRQAEKADVILFGELHNNPIAHWLAYELVRDLHAQRPGRLLLGLEMLETDQQPQLDQYLRGELPDLQGKITLWPNFATDYAPLVAYARAAKIPCFGTNAPQRLVRQVGRSGLAAIEGWSEAEKAYVAPLPFPRLDSLPTYKQLDSLAQAHGMPAEPFRLAQMLRDATMAYTISRQWRPGQIFFHLNGRYHSDYGEGIAAYLRLYRPGLRLLILSTEEASEPQRYRPPSGLADIILVVPASMTKTH